MNQNPPLDPNQILIAEYTYIAQTAFQANEDRARVSSYYFVTAGAAVAAILSANVDGTTPPMVYLGLGALFGVLAVIGWLTVRQLARLRLAWNRSAQALNKIKTYYRAHCEQPLAPAFDWDEQDLPAPDDPGSIAALLSKSAMVIDAVSLTVAFAYIGRALIPSGNEIPILIVGIIAGVVFFRWQYHRFFKMLRADKA
jgi:type II secretory pathway pseudopilin PulG